MSFFTQKSTVNPASSSSLKKTYTGINDCRTAGVLVMAVMLMISATTMAGERYIPDMPGNVSGQINVCPFVGTGTSVNYSILPVAGAELYLWTVPSTVSIVSGQGTTGISVTFAAGFTSAANKQIKVRSISQDGNSADRIIYLVSQQPSTPASINGPSNACIYIGTNNQATYTTAKDPTATGYIWATDEANTQVSHPNGPGENDTIIKVIFKSLYKTNPVSVQSVNNCGFSAMRILNVSGAAPSQPGPITGPTNGCAYMLPNGVAATYSINPVNGAAAYTWNTPANCVVNHPNGPGVNDFSITVQYPHNFVSGTISVIASSGCDDSSPRSLSIGKLNPSTPGVITPVEQAICPDREYLYKLPSMPANSTTVNWTVPADALSITGQGTASIVVAYPGTHIVGMVTATAVNNCASSSTRQSPVDILRCQVERPGGNTAGRGVSQNNTSANANASTINDQQQELNVYDGELKVSVGPNPAKADFKLLVSSPDKELIIMKLLDLQGRELKKMNVIKGQPAVFGSELKPGTYIMEVSQGKARLTAKLLKL